MRHSHVRYGRNGKKRETSSSLSGRVGDVIDDVLAGSGGFNPTEQKNNVLATCFLRPGHTPQHSLSKVEALPLCLLHFQCLFRSNEAQVACTSRSRSFIFRKSFSTQRHGEGKETGYYLPVSSSRISNKARLSLSPNRQTPPAHPTTIVHTYRMLLLGPFWQMTRCKYPRVCMSATMHTRYHSLLY